MSFVSSDPLLSTASIETERAISEFRSGRPVIISQDETSILVVSAENIDGFSGHAHAHLVLPAARLRRIGLDRDEAGSIALPVWDQKRIETLAFALDAKIDAPVHAVTALDQAALTLAQLSFMMPALVIMPIVKDAANGILSVAAEKLLNYSEKRQTHVTLVSRAPVPLEDAFQTEFVVFRGGEGLRDQVAIIIGKPDFSKPVAVRLHSACLTGDLFGSLKCDCGDQLRSTVKNMSDQNGGVLLYLDQEGRNNGLANKIRAYALQAKGYDTYDADEVLGFERDQRHFGFAAEMLKQLGVFKVTLHTNNPEKIKTLQQAGIEVVSEERVVGRTTAENVRYLASKRDRAGHKIE